MDERARRGAIGAIIGGALVAVGFGAASLLGDDIAACNEAKVHAERQWVYACAQAAGSHDYDIVHEARTLTTGSPAEAIVAARWAEEHAVVPGGELGEAVAASEEAWEACKGVDP